MIDAQPSKDEQPVVEGQVIMTTIESHGREGDPVGFIGGLAVFIKDGEVDESYDIGDVVRIRINKVTKNYAFAHALDVL